MNRNISKNDFKKVVKEMLKINDEGVHEKPFSERLPHYIIWGYGHSEKKYGDILFQIRNERNFGCAIKLGRKKGYTKFTISTHVYSMREFNNMCNAFQGKKTYNDLIYINEKNQISHGDRKGIINGQN